MSALAARTCMPCSGDVPPLQGAPLNRLHDELNNNWQVVEGHHLEKEYTFPDFRSALNFTNRVSELAEEVWHHPDLYLNNVRLNFCMAAELSDATVRYARSTPSHSPTR